MSIQELVTKYLKEQENMAIMSFEGQHKSFPSNLEGTKEEESVSYNEEITSRDDEKLETFQKVENDARTLEPLAVKEDEPNSLELYEKIKDGVVNTIPKMAPWGETH